MDKRKEVIISVVALLAAIAILAASLVPIINNEENKIDEGVVIHKQHIDMIWTPFYSVPDRYILTLRGVKDGQIAIYKMEVDRVLYSNSEIGQEIWV